MKKIRFVFLVCAICLVFFCCTTLANATSDKFNVTFYAKVSDELAQEHDYLEFTVHSDAGIIYNYSISARNNWLLKTNLPAGNYRIIEGGVPKDWLGKYPIEYKKFEISPLIGNFIQFKVGDVSTPSIDWGDESKPSQAPSDTSSEISSNVSDEHNSSSSHHQSYTPSSSSVDTSKFDAVTRSSRTIFTVFVSIICCVAIAIAFLMYRRNKV